jgi:hypothetical protein
VDRLDRSGRRAQEVEMQWILLIGAVLLSLGLAVGTASIAFTLFFRILQKLR